MKLSIFSLFKKQPKKVITVDLIKREHPDIYKAIFNQGVVHVHQLGLYADDLKEYPGGEVLATKVKSGEITIEEASYKVVKSLDTEKKEEQKEKKPGYVIGFHLD